MRIQVKQLAPNRTGYVSIQILKGSSGYSVQIDVHSPDVIITSSGAKIVAVFNITSPGLVVFLKIESTLLDQTPNFREYELAQLPHFLAHHPSNCSQLQYDLITSILSIKWDIIRISRYPRLITVQLFCLEK